MKAKKLFANFIVLVIFGAAVFCIGWITFLVKPGYCAVMVSKTSGILDKPVLPGSFIWRWEKLLPTNVTLETFNLSPFKSTQVVSGELPSSKTYRDYASLNCDFSYNIKMNFTMSIVPEKIVELYKANKLRTDEDLREYLSTKAKVASQILAESILMNNSTFGMNLSAFTEDGILKVLMEKKSEFDGIAFSAVEISDCKLPDYELYLKVKKSYDSYFEYLNKRLEEQADRHAASYVDQQKTIEQLEKLGELMKKYPNIHDLFKSGDAALIINSMKSIR